MMTPPSGTALADIRPTAESRPRPSRRRAPRFRWSRRAQVLERERKAEDDFVAAVRKLDQGQIDPARREFHRLAVADPGVKKYRVWMNYAKGREHQVAGRLDEARAEYRRALDLDDSFAPARGALGSLEPAPGGDKPSGGLFSRLFRK
jgi:tetratricopeptide (TPR) repeat protein